MWMNPDRQSATHPAARVARLFVAACAAAIAVVSGCAPSAAATRCTPVIGKESDLIVFLLDTSLTVQYLRAFESAWNEVVSRAHDGDTIMLASVKGDSRGSDLGEFPYQLSRTLPCYSVVESPSRYTNTRTEAITALQRAFPAAVRAARPRRTMLLSSLRSVAKVYANYPGPRILVMATDGLEDSDVARFETMQLAPPVATRLIESQRDAETNRQMKGVSVWVVAAGTATEAKSLEVENFWKMYFKAVGANLDPAHYAGTLLGYPE